jgi:hypothetical protein
VINVSYIDTASERNIEQILEKELDIGEEVLFDLRAIAQLKKTDLLSVIQTYVLEGIKGDLKESPFPFPDYLSQLED